MRVLFGCRREVYDNGETTSDVLTYNHFGTETIPPRPALRIAAENTIPKNKERIRAYLRNILANKTDKERLEVVLLTSIGQQTIAEAKRIIDSGDQLQENAPATIRKKGFNQPLYEEGKLKKSLGYQIEE
jgi:hypothetical protein